MNRSRSSTEPWYIAWCKGWRVVGLLTALWLSVMIVWLVRRPAPMDHHAETLFYAMLDADGRTLMSYAFPEEIDANNLDAKKLNLVYEELIVPRLGVLTDRSPVIIQDRGTNGFAGFDARINGKREFGFSTSVYLHDAGVKTSVLQSLYIAWCVEYMSEHDEAMSAEVRNRAVLQGLQRDKQRLQEIGITHLTNIDLSNGEITMMEINGMEKGYERWVANPELKK